MKTLRTARQTARFIADLMRANSDALGFIPSTHLEHYFLKRGQTIIQSNTRGRPIGYILHGPPTWAQPLKCYQCCIDIDHRRRRHATAAVATLIRRARNAGAPAIELRCASDLEAHDFWLACGFQPIHVSPGGARRGRSIITYRLHLGAAPTLPEAASRARA
ncbi:MAG: GNAT family N-acetyltransferase [Gallionellaceae bacterium]|nr:GNAT family N-acetyltransferase [Gallionellaceae bacterium]